MQRHVKGGCTQQRLLRGRLREADIDENAMYCSVDV